MVNSLLRLLCTMNFFNSKQRVTVTPLLEKLEKR